jgi:hypothetical protein
MYAPTVVSSAGVASAATRTASVEVKIPSGRHASPTTTDRPDSGF